MTTPPPRKLPRLDSDLTTSASSTTGQPSTSVNCDAGSDSTSGPVEQKAVEATNLEKEKGQKDELSQAETDSQYLYDEEQSDDESHDVQGPMMTLCTPESQLTPPSGMESEDDNGGRCRELKALQEENKVKSEELESGSRGGEKIEVKEEEENKKCAINVVLLNSQLESPPTSPLSPTSSVGHDHTYCSQTTEDKEDCGNTTSVVHSEVKSDGSEVGGGERESRVTESGRSMLSTMVHDHTYCFQEDKNNTDSSESLMLHSDTREDINKEHLLRVSSGDDDVSTDRGDEEESRTKLSLMTHDHIYCSNSWKERNETSLMETACEHHGDDDPKAVLKEERREEDAEEEMEGDGGMAKGTTEESYGVVDKIRAARDEDGNRVINGIKNVSLPVNLDNNFDSDVFMSESESSQSQELFSQQASQVPDDVVLDHLLVSNVVQVTGSSHNLPTTSKGAHGDGGGEDKETEEEMEGVVVAKGDSIDVDGSLDKRGLSICADSAKGVEVYDGKESTTGEGDKERGQEACDLRKEKSVVVNSSHDEIKLQSRTSTSAISTGSDGSSDSSNPTNIAECSQCPPSATDPALSSSSLSVAVHTQNSTHSTSHNHMNSESSEFRNVLSLWKQVSEKVCKLMNEKTSSSFSREDILASQDVIGTATNFTQIFNERLSEVIQQRL